MIVHLIRHGQTSFNRDGLGLGRMDPPLTDLGRLQAAALARRLGGVPLTRILSSPLQRARETATTVAGERAVAVETHAELTEMDAGETDGLPLAELRERFPDFLREWLADDPTNVRMPGGESLREVAARLAPLVEELRQPSDEVVAVVAHNFVLKVMICELLGVEIARFRGLSVDLASLSTLAVTRRGVTIVSLNDCCHRHDLSVELQQRSL